MIDRALHPADAQSIEAVLREELARGDAVARTVLPVLRYLVAAEDCSIFSDEILARVRGMLTDLAKALLDGLPEVAGSGASGAEFLARALLDDPALLSHVHALALEWRLTERLQDRLGFDPVISPLLQTLIYAPDAAAQGLARRFLAAQARWCESQRRMAFPLFELPEQLFDAVLAALRSHLAHAPDLAERVDRSTAAMREGYDESAGRLALASRLVQMLGEGQPAAISVGHAGVALFLTALGQAAGQSRDAVAMTTHETQIARLVLMLRCAGLHPVEVERQLLALHPEITPPPGFDSLAPDLAAAMLAGSMPG